MSDYVRDEIKWKKELAEAPWLGDPDDDVKSEFLKASGTIDWQISDKELVGKTIMCAPLNLKHGTGTKINFYERTRVFGNNNTVKRQKVESLSKYDRLVEFADLKDGGNCFVMIFREQAKARQMLKNCTDISALGTPMLLGNPRKCVNTMTKSGLPIIEADFPLVPLTVEDGTYDIRKVMPIVPILVPEEPGELKYFVLHEVKIEISRFQYLTETVSCTGRMCDRARELVDKSVSCGCINTQFDRKGTVAEMTVRFPIPISVNGTEYAEVENFRSHRFTELVFADNKAMQKLDRKSIGDKYVKHNKAISQLADYVNSKDGWTILGWFRRGQSADSSTEGATAESQRTTLHIALLTPTNATLRKLEDDGFKNLRLTASTSDATGVVHGPNNDNNT